MKDFNLEEIKKSNKPFFIAEIGINHNGSLDTAKQLANAAIESGADIVKTQMHHLSEMLPYHKWYQLMKDCFLSIANIAELQDFVESSDATFLVTPFCAKAANDLSKYINPVAFKTGSGEANNIPFLCHIAQFGKPMIISTGMTSRNELVKSLDAVRKINPDVILMNCTSIYPATPKQARLQRINW